MNIASVSFCIVCSSLSFSRHSISLSICVFAYFNCHFYFRSLMSIVFSLVFVYFYFFISFSFHLMWPIISSVILAMLGSDIGFSCIFRVVYFNLSWVSGYGRRWTSQVWALWDPY